MSLSWSICGAELHVSLEESGEASLGVIDIDMMVNNFGTAQFLHQFLVEQTD